MQDYFIKQYFTYQFEFRRDYINSKDIWYNVAVKVEGINIKCRMHNDENRTWKITGRRINPLFLRLEEDLNEAIAKNEVYK